MDGGGARRGGVHDAGVREGVLQTQAGESLLGGLRFAAAAGGRVAGRVGHRVRLVEDDDAVEGVAARFVEAAGEPADDLVETRGDVAAGGGAESGVGAEKDAAAAREMLRRAVVGEGKDIGLVLADFAPVAPGVLDELGALANPERAHGAAHSAVENHGGTLASLAAPGAVAEHPSLAEAHGGGEFEVDLRVGGVEWFAALVDGDGSGMVRGDAVQCGQ